jgi:superfamily II DNA/RNA helicase
MPFKKINAPLKEVLESKGFEEPLPFQKKILSKIKSGANLFGIAPEGSGKTTSIIISTIQKLGSEAFEDAPRALIFVKDKEAALELEQKFKDYTRRMDLRVFAAFDEPNMETQKGEIYSGVDIVIATTKRLNQLFLHSGINLSQLQLFIVEDAGFLIRNKAFIDLIRIPESINKCQYLVFSDKYDAKMERLKDSFMAHSQLIELKESK